MGNSVTPPESPSGQPPNPPERPRSTKRAWSPTAAERPAVLTGWRHRLHEFIYEADTPAGRWFDIMLFVAIFASVAVVMLESVASYRAQHGALLRRLEWLFTILFTIEYVLRLISVARPRSYALSFFGFIDLLAILPTYASVIFVGSQSFAVIRIVRLLRVFRVLKLVQFLGEANRLKSAMRASGHKVFVFLLAVTTMVISIGAVMYYIEGEASGFTSIPESVYWAIVTMTTVGYGDITPQTVLGKFLSAIVMIVGYAIIAVPTGIVTAELVHTVRGEVSTQACPSCLAEGHRADAVFCRRCATRFERGNRCLTTPSPKSNAWKSPRTGFPGTRGCRWTNSATTSYSPTSRPT